MEHDNRGCSNTVQGTLDRLEVGNPIILSFHSGDLPGYCFGWLALSYWAVFFLRSPHGVVPDEYLLSEKPVRVLGSSN